METKSSQVWKEEQKHLQKKLSVFGKISPSHNTTLQYKISLNSVNILLLSRKANNIFK